MANYYLDNDDIRFLFRHYRLTALADIMEGDYADSKSYAWAPADGAEAVENYDRILQIIGDVSAEQIAPRAEAVDLEGNTLEEDGTVVLAQGTQANLKALAQAQVMGFTLPHRFGGLNCPSLIYTMSTEMVSRADAGLMNIYGLQGIAETINAFASEDIKQEYLPGFAEGKTTGAMVLTEPDAGSDLQAIKLRAYQDEKGQWRLHGVKRFITNGCGEVLLVLSRSEPDRSGGLGLSLFVCDRGPTVRVRRLENKLGIHGSPTCELYFNHTPCKLIGERQRGLVTYVMSLMNGARVGIAAQSLGIAEAAYRVARDYAASRKQFGTAIEAFPAVRDMLIEMKLDIETARALTYETCWTVDHHYGIARTLEFAPPADKDALKQLKQEEKKYKRLAGMLTPMSKYVASEMSNRVTYDAIQVLGGSGYMKDYAAERHARDARITTIYEGTSQLQVIAAVRGVCSGAADKLLLEYEATDYPAEAQELVEQLKKGREKLNETIAFVKEQAGTDYMDLYGRKLTDMAVYLICGHLLLRQGCLEPARVDEFTTKAPAGNGDASDNAPSPYRAIQTRKKLMARRYITKKAPVLEMLAREIVSNDRSSLQDFDVLVGPAAEC